jgi:hypothetical protein
MNNPDKAYDAALAAYRAAPTATSKAQLHRAHRTATAATFREMKMAAELIVLMDDMVRRATKSAKRGKTSEQD